MKYRTTLIALSVVLAGQLLSAKPEKRQAAGVEIVQASEVNWTHLNPKRGDLAPKAGTLWGDREGTGPTGFLLKPPQNFESPPHIHNISYRGVVIEGVIHNDDPNAASMWMPAGSFWTQPKGEVHITAAEGSGSLAYIEIEEGPYLVQPADEAFDSGERPVNIDQRNIVWLDASDIKWVNQTPESTAIDGPQVAILWGQTEKGQLNGSFIKLPAGFTGTLHSQGSSLRAVVVKGTPNYHGTKDTSLAPGSYFSAKGEGLHRFSTTEESIFYVRADGKYQVLPAE